LLAGGNAFVKIPASRWGHDGHSQPVEQTLLLAASPRRPGVRCVQHFPFLGFLPAPVDGWCDITDLFVKRYGVPAAGRAVFICAHQHINGCNDPPKQVRTIVRAA
jgi:hypothetical protein